MIERAQIVHIPGPFQEPGSRHLRLRSEHDVRIRKTASQRTQHREEHDQVAQMTARARDQDPAYAARTWGRQGAPAEPCKVIDPARRHRAGKGNLRLPRERRPSALDTLMRGSRCRRTEAQASVGGPILGLLQAQDQRVYGHLPGVVVIHMIPIIVPFLGAAAEQAGRPAGSEEPLTSRPKAEGNSASQAEPPDRATERTLEAPYIVRSDLAGLRRAWHREDVQALLGLEECRIRPGACGTGGIHIEDAVTSSSEPFYQLMRCTAHSFPASVPQAENVHPSGTRKSDAGASCPRVRPPRLHDPVSTHGRGRKELLGHCS